MLHKIDPQLTDEEIHLAFTVFDVDGSGDITFKEFKDVLEKYLKVLGD